MAELELRNQLTAVELAKRSNNTELLTIVEVMSQHNALLDDAPWLPSNQDMSHIILRRNSVPTPSHRGFNEGITPSATSTDSVVEALAMLEDYSDVDKALADISPNKDQFISQEAAGILEGMAQTQATTLIYGSRAANPKSIDGLAARYYTHTTDPISVCVYDAGGTGSDLTSLWLVDWGVNKVHLIYPKHMSETSGIKKINLGEVTAQQWDATNTIMKLMQAYRTHFKSYYGLAVHDDRRIRRMCNIEVSGATHLFDDDLLIDMINDMPDDNTGSMVIYVNKNIKAQIDKLAKDKANVNWSMDSVFGKRIAHFQGIPIRKCDAILSTESEIT